MTAQPTTVLERVRDEVGGVNADAGADALRIGVLTPLTGPGDATAGELVVRGACLGVRYVREQLGGDARLAVENDQATAAEEGMQRSAVAGVAKLAMIDQVSALLGQWHLRTTPAVAATTEQLGIPIFIENGHSTVTAEARRTVFRTYFTVAERAELMTDFMAEQGMRRVAVLAADTVFGLSTAEALEDCGRRHGIEFLRIEFPQETAEDLRPALRKIAEFGPDLFVNDGVIRTNYLIVEQAVEVGLLPAVPMMVTFGFPMRSQDYWRLAGPAGDRVVWPATFYRPSWDGLTEVGAWFTEQYRARYQAFPPDTSLSAFTDVTIIARAAASARRPGWEGLIEALESRDFPTWRGPVRFRADGAHLHHAAPDICLMQYQRYGQDFDDAAIVHPAAVRTAGYLPPDGTC